MKFIAILQLLLFLSISSIEARRIVPLNGGEVQRHRTGGLKKAIKKELDEASDQIADVIAQHIERALQEHVNKGTSFLQASDWKETAKRMGKSILIEISKGVLPSVATIVAHSVKPPATDPLVYEAVMKPVCKDVFHQVSGLLKVAPHDEIWDYKAPKRKFEDDDDDDDLDDEDDLDFDDDELLS